MRMQMNQQQQVNNDEGNVQYDYQEGGNNMDENEHEQYIYQEDEEEFLNKTITVGKNNYKATVSSPGIYIISVILVD